MWWWEWGRARQWRRASERRSLRAAIETTWIWEREGGFKRFKVNQVSLFTLLPFSILHSQIWSLFLLFLFFQFLLSPHLILPFWTQFTFLFIYQFPDPKRKKKYPTFFITLFYLYLIFHDLFTNSLYTWNLTIALFFSIAGLTWVYFRVKAEYIIPCFLPLKRPKFV